MKPKIVIDDQVVDVDSPEASAKQLANVDAFIHQNGAAAALSGFPAGELRARLSARHQQITERAAQLRAGTRGAAPMTQTADAELMTALNELGHSIRDMKRQAVDRETVERIVADVMARQRGAQSTRSGYWPSDDVAFMTPPAGHIAELQGGARFEAVLTTNARQVADELGAARENIEHLQQTSDTLLMLAAAKRCSPTELDYYKAEYLPALRQAGAMDAATTAEGRGYVPTLLSSALIERINLELRVASLFPQVDMPSNPFKVPGLPVARQRTSKQVEQTSDTGQTKFSTLVPATRDITLTAAKFAGEILVSRDLEEDAILAMLPFAQSELIDYVSADIEDCILNGDTTATHQDSDVTDAKDPRRNWAGLRKLAIAGAKTDGSAAVASLALARGNRKKMGKYGVIPGDLAHITSINGFLQLLADASLITLDKYGPQATVLNGELGKLDGAPLIVSEYVRADLNASGVYDASTTDRSLLLTVNRRGYLIGTRRREMVQVLRELYAESDQDAVIMSVRKAFSPRFTSTTEKTVAVTYNLATT